MTAPASSGLRAPWWADPDLGCRVYRHPRRLAVVHDGPPPARPKTERHLSLLPPGARPALLREWRIGQRLSQAQVAGLLQVPPGRVALWERGDVVPPVEVLAALGVDTDWMEASR
ncbi:hypothetical protein GCM10011608_09620 [Micromonospora sonchi]|uniref:HTH cro/C1-type domain-containing protein n=1 Tax=Micromonospora sonchi TaxID=1763543 RepID=A0A917TLM0_9ACTN|nr:helix-turn-helix transcriptional regulator [Micromonospora sonchi]GGM26906.1 hypothetical protein GCM10011608_09620 [Micromonospora sonchi]